MPKAKGTSGGNPNPKRTPKVIAQTYKRVEGDPFYFQPLADKPLQIRMYQPVMDALEKMPPKERTLWLRKVIAETAIRELGVVLEH